MRRTGVVAALVDDNDTVDEDRWRTCARRGKLQHELALPVVGPVDHADTVPSHARLPPPNRRYGVELSDFFRSLSSLYQTLPTYRCLDLGDGSLRRLGDLELPGLDAARVREGMSVLRQLEAAAIERSRVSPMLVVPVVGLDQPTAQSARLIDGRLETIETYEGQDVRGDGVVSRLSATPAWLGEGRAIFVRARHGHLPSSDDVLTFLGSALTATDIDISLFRTVTKEAVVVLQVPESAPANEPWPVEVEHRSSASGQVAVYDEHGEQVTIKTFSGSARPGASDTIRIEPLPPGFYRIDAVVSGETVASAMTILFDSERE